MRVGFFHGWSEEEEAGLLQAPLSPAAAWPRPAAVSSLVSEPCPRPATEEEMCVGGEAGEEK